jgi:hypothetical protein
VVLVLVLVVVVLVPAVAAVVVVVVMAVAAAVVAWVGGGAGGDACVQSLPPRLSFPHATNQESKLCVLPLPPLILRLPGIRCPRSSHTSGVQKLAGVRGRHTQARRRASSH